MAVEADRIRLPSVKPDDFKDFEDSEHALAFYKLRQESDALKDDEIVGRILSWQVADGFAYYKVVKEQPLTVAHIDFLDGWEVSPILIKGLDIDDVRSIVAHDRKIKKLFDGSPDE